MLRIFGCSTKEDERTHAVSRDYFPKLEASTPKEAFGLLKEKGCSMAFIEFDSTEEYLDTALFVAVETAAKVKGAQMVGARSVSAWIPGIIAALPDWKWRVGYSFIEQPLAQAQLPPELQKALRGRH